MIVPYRKALYRSFIIISFLLISVASADAQVSVLSRPVTVSAVNQPLSEVLYRIGRQASIKFSYDPDELSARRLVSIEAKKEPLNKVLVQLLNNPALSFRAMGNQVIIFKPAAEAATAIEKSKPEAQKYLNKNSTIRLKPDTLSHAARYRIDTVFVTNTDTILRIDTLIFRDTVVHRDTVFIEKYKARKIRGNRNNNFDKELVKNRKFQENNGFSVGLSYSQYYGKATYAGGQGSLSGLLEKSRQSESVSLQNLSAGIAITYDYKRIGAGTGLFYTRLGEIFDHEYIEQTGGFYIRDTVETYYTVDGADTLRYYITDSTWQNLDTKKFSYTNPNAFRYLDVPLSLQLFAVKNENFNLYIKGGAVAGILIGSKALVVSPDDYKAEWIDRSRLNPVVFSWFAGLGAAFRISGKLSLEAEAFYRRQVSSLYSDYPLDKTYRLPGFRAGMCIKL